MIPLKTPQEIEIMRAGGRKLRQVLEKVLFVVKPGITTAQLDKIAEAEILRLGGQPSFKKVPGYCWSSCLTINEEVVHGIPGGKKVQLGDILGVDVGIYFQGFHTDLATTIEVGGGETEFLAAGRKALETALRKAKMGNYVGDLSWAIEKEIKKAGYSAVEVLSGHGVGRQLHEEPTIPCFLEGNRQQTPKLKEGMTLAIEVIYNQGSSEVFLTDGWTIVTKDGKISGLFEETVAVTGSGPLILTR